MECSICLNEYDSTTHIPKLLNPCGHTFCLLCLSHPSHAASKKLCFNCEKEYESLTTNFAVLEPLSYKSAESKRKKKDTSNTEVIELLSDGDDDDDDEVIVLQEPGEPIYNSNKKPRVRDSDEVIARRLDSQYNGDADEQFARKLQREEMQKNDITQKFSKFVPIFGSAGDGGAKLRSSLQDMEDQKHKSSNTSNTSNNNNGDDL